MDRLTLPCLSSSFQGLIPDDDGVNFFPSPYDETLSQLSKTYATLPSELWMVRGEIVERTNELLTLTQRTGSFDLSIEDIGI